jgi:arylsulfatase A-like enzyme
MTELRRAGLRAGLASGLVWGLLLGVVDGAVALYVDPEFAGPFSDRIGTLALAMALYAASLAALGALLVPALSRLIPARVRLPLIPRRPTTVLACSLLSLAAALAVAGLGWSGQEPAPEGRPNVILISIDTLRADHLSVYGYGRKTSPNLDTLAGEGVLFESAYSHATWTLPSHASLFTGLDPFAHGTLSRNDRLVEAHVTLAEILQAAGYWTGAWVGTEDWGYVGSRFGLDQGFSSYRHHPHRRRFRSSLIGGVLDRAQRRRERWRGSASEEVDSLIAWLRGIPPEPFFLFVHFFDVHSRFHGLPYSAPDPFFERFCPGELDGYTGCRGDLCASDLLLAVQSGREGPPSTAEFEKMQCLYDGAIAFVDAEIGRLLDALREEGLYDGTIVVVTSDHGEAFLEHGMPLHSTLHDEVIRVPLIVRAPGAADRKRVRGAVGLIDLLPTLLELTGTFTDTPVQGTSLAEVIRSWPAEAPEAELLATDWKPHSTAIRLGEGKFIENPGQRNSYRRAPDEVYDLATDPSERSNVALARAELAREYREVLNRKREESRAIHRAIAGDEPSRPVELSEEEREALRALGYATDE